MWSESIGRSELTLTDCTGIRDHSRGFLGWLGEFRKQVVVYASIRQQPRRPTL